MIRENNLTQALNNHSINLASLAVEAMLYELSCNPSPGLVSRFSNGAHEDMDYFTFLASTSALIKPLIHCAEAGFSSTSPQAVFKQIREIGKLGEQQMFAKTSGVNTHKGMLFLLGICCAAGGRALYSGTTFLSLQSIIKAMTEGLVDKELKSRCFEFKEAVDSSLTHGERLFLHHDIEGIRGEVEKGLPTVFDYSLGFYQENYDLGPNDRLVQTLLVIMQFCEDSTILHRYSVSTLQEVQARAKYILSLGGVKTPQGYEAILAMDREFSRRKISPGGSADLLGVTVFLHLLEEYMESRLEDSLKEKNSF